jgi:tRNA U34 2-thiouridine synthase MnmA/TrmU
VIGLYMRNWDEEDESGQYECPAKRDWMDVLKVCDQIGIECKRVDFVKEYWNHVFSPFIQAYERGLTPNPDILCNKVRRGSPLSLRLLY